jgi:hypothetical protein
MISIETSNVSVGHELSYLHINITFNSKICTKRVPDYPVFVVSRLAPSDEVRGVVWVSFL